MYRKVEQTVIERIKMNNLEKPDFIIEDLETLDFKEKNKSLIIDYSYQRNFLQNQVTASKYVESVFLGLIIPEIQVYENKSKGYREIIDGQQRVLSLLKFLRNEYRLRGLTYLKALNGKKFSDLPEELKSVYKQFCINMRVAKNPSEDYKYLLFERLNIGSKPLNQQEIRNCVFKDNPILKMTRKTSKEKCMVDLIEGIGRIKDTRFLNDEFILGVLAARFSDITTKTSTLLKDRINDYLLDTNDMPKDEAEEIFKEFTYIVELLVSKYDLNTIVSNYLIRKSILETMIIAMWKVKDKKKLEDKADLVEIAIYELVNSEKFKETLERGEAQTNKLVSYRINAMLNEINKVIA